MTTTSNFQVKYDFYENFQECKINKANKIQTNPRYKNFYQTHFTVGDENQFDEYRYENNGSCIFEKDISLEKNIFKNFKVHDEWSKYKNVNSNTVLDTFRYIFFKFKKGIFIKIQNNELKVFLPFSNANFENEWSHLIKIDPKFPSTNDFFKYISEMQNYTFKPNNVNGITKKWYSNNSLMRYEYPVYEGDTNVSVIKNLFEELCSSRQVNDVELFINRRDFPLLSRGGFEPYYNIWDSYDKPLISHNYEKYIPILSMSGNEKFADILIPSYEDWIRVTNKHFLNSSKNDYQYDFEDLDWKDKKPIAVFRGGSTGCGVTIDTNMRLKISYLSSLQKKDVDDELFLDAGITNWNVRARKIMGYKYLQTIDIDKLPFKLSNKLNYKEQSCYKYIIHIDGHVSALRLSYELSMNSVILIVESEWKNWFSDFLKPYEHYVPVKSDLSDIYEQIRWCKMNDLQCREIAKNAKEFYNKFLCKDGILDYVQKLLINLKKDSGFYLYNYIKPLDYLMEKEQVQIFQKELNNSIIFEIPKLERSFNLLKGIKKAIFNNDIVHKELNKIIEGDNNSIIFKNKFGYVRKINYANFVFSVKSTNDHNKIKEYIHEAFIGFNATNNLLKYVPNFNYIFDIYKSDSENYNILTEYTNGITFQEYIKSPEFNFFNFLNIILQLCLALNIAQEKYLFVHNDLTPWNIILKITHEPQVVEYILDSNTVYKFTTNIVPIIIDYGKSHIVNNGENHGFINMYKFSKCQDIVTLLITSVFEILNYDDYNNKNSLKLINFISGNDFRQQPFTYQKETYQFLKNEKKYTNLISNNKNCLESKTPLELFKYIRKEFLYKFNIVEINESKNLMNNGDYEQVYNYITSSTDEDRIKTFLNVFENESLINSFNSENLIHIYQDAQNMEQKIVSNNENFLKFLNSKGLPVDKKYEKLFKSSLKRVYNFFTNKIKTTKESNIEVGLKKCINEFCDFDENTFLNPREVERIISNLKNNKTIDIVEFKLEESVFLNKGKFSLSSKHKKYYTKYLKYKIFDNLNDISFNSLVSTSKYIYDFNLEKIKDTDQYDKEHIVNYRRIYDKIKEI